ncbi:MAG: MFS transporter [Candidatus Cryptobacteroides sp.]|nr:MFS transporter [Candidatus Cryptobacteroides sp.]
MLSEKKYYPWIVIVLLVIVSTLNYLDRQMLATMRPFMMADIRELESVTNFGRLMAIFLWIYAIMSPISGMIADRSNRKWLIVFSLAIWSGVTMAMGFVHDIRHLYVLRAVMGVSEAFYIPAALSLAADYHQGSTRSTAIGILTSGVYLGQAFGGFGATIAARTSWEFTFQIFGIVGILYSFVLIAFLREKKNHIEVKEAETGLVKEMASSFKGLSVLFTNIAFWVMLFYFAALNLPGWTTKNWLPTMISESLGISMENAGPISTIALAMSSFIGVFIGGWLSDKWVVKSLKGRVYTSSLGLFLIVPALIMMNFGGSLLTAVLSAVMFGLGFGMFDTNNMPILCQFIPSRYRATGYGIMNMVGISAGAIITTALGKALEQGYQNEIFYLMTGVVFISILLQLTVLHPKTQDMTEELMEKA